ncbi:MAG: hypothetical protein KBT46_05125, partial [Ruminococcus sp.]|nr:hypothetical protein [Candidatus Copronaster equi]
MAVIRIDNLTDDSVVIELDNKEYSIEEDATVSIQNIEKGNYNLTVKRRKDRSDEVVIRQENSGDLIDKMKVNEKSHHVQICSEFLINLNSSKSVITLKKNISGSSKGGMDIIFSSFDINVTGAKIENKKEY